MPADGLCHQLICCDTMRIIQITDLHVGLPDEKPFGVDLRENTRTIIEAVALTEADALVITGDLCYRDGDAAIYAWIKEQLKALQMPVYLLSGNHDDTLLLSQVFGLDQLLTGNELYYQHHWSGHPVFFLDSSSGRISPQQLAWLDQGLAATDDPTVIFMHHPPLVVGVPYMEDQYALQNREEVRHLLLQQKQPVTVFTGHFHVDKSVHYQNIDLHVSPSCFFQIDWRVPDFKVDHHRIAYRWIELTPAGVQHSVCYQ